MSLKNKTSSQRKFCQKLSVIKTGMSPKTKKIINTEMSNKIKGHKKTKKKTENLNVIQTEISKTEITFSSQSTILKVWTLIL